MALLEFLSRFAVVLCMTVDVTAVFADYLAGNRGPDPNNPDQRQRPDYGVAARLADGILEVELTFRRGSAYCCSEWGCHLALQNHKHWEGFRRRLTARNIEVSPRLELHLTCVIEDGAIFFDFRKPDPRRRGYYGFEPAARHRYQVRIVEGANDS